MWRRKNIGTLIRPGLSKKNEYWIYKHRYYELKHFCLQYSIWKKAYNGLDAISKSPYGLEAVSKTNEHCDPMVKCAEAREVFYERMAMIEQTTILTDFGLSTYILKAVTEGKSYDYLKTKLNIPCGKDTYYDLYRKFFWLLNKARN